MEALLETERLKLRPPTPADAEAIAVQIGDWDVAKMLSRVPYPYTVGDAHDFIAAVEASRRAGKRLVLAVTRKSELVGIVGLDDIRRIESEPIANLGYWFGRAHWHKGYATEAVRAVVKHAFEDLSLAGLKSGHFKENHRSGRVLAKLGFRYAGEGMQYCLARGEEVPHVDVVLPRACWADFAAHKAA